MKKFNIYKIIAILFVAISVSCVDNNDYEIPTIGADKTYANLEDLATLVGRYKGDMVAFPKGDNTEELNTFGYVVSNDRGGNFFKTLIIQDKPENPTVAVKVLIDATNLGANFNVGRKVYIRLNGLALNKNFESFELGAAGESRLDRIEESEMFNFIERSSELVEIVPTTLKISEIEDKHINTMVRIENMQSEIVGVTFANQDANDTSNVNRNLVSCETQETIIMRTSGFSRFKALQIPAKKGSVTAILGKFKSDYQLFINEAKDLEFTESRCGSFFEEDFQIITKDRTDLSVLTNWTSYVEEGSRAWLGQEHQGNGYVEFSGFKTGDDSNIGWLISPGIDMDAQEGEVLTFQAAQHHVKDAKNNTLEVFVSTDFDGANVAAATWTKVEATLPNEDSSWYKFESAGNIDLSNYTGTLHVAFKSIASGNNSNLSGSYMIDNFKLFSK